MHAGISIVFLSRLETSLSFHQKRFFKISMIRAAENITKLSILGKESIILGTQLTDYITQDLSQSFSISNYVLISDENIAPLYLHALHNSLQLKVQARVLTYVIQSGEGSKSRDTKREIEDYLFQNNVTRDTILVALGGGVIGDLVGFVAATYMRGIPVVQIPTSLLAMVDSSIGGKTGIDTPDGGKNLIGAFHQPVRIYIDLKYLTTLPARELRNGFAEIIKTAAISSSDSFSELENSINVIENFISGSAQGACYSDKQWLMLQNIVVSSIKFKAYVVTNDEKESGLRSLLNFGHSIGHAIEAIYSPLLLHGECVSIGMILEAELSRSMNSLKQVTLARLTSVIKAYGLPTSINEPMVIKLLGDRRVPEGLAGLILDKMRIDKKNIGNTKRIVLLKNIGQTNSQGCDDVEDGMLMRVLCDSIRFESFFVNNLHFKPQFNDNGLVTPIEHYVDSSPSTPSSFPYGNEDNSKNSFTNPPAKQPMKIINVPGSKSISNRALLLASLSKGCCRLKGLLYSDDTKVMLNAMKILFNINYSWKDEGETLVINGNDGLMVNPANTNKNESIYLGNAGTAARFLTSVCAFYQLLNPSKQSIIITGNDRMKARPIGPLVDALSQIGSQIRYLEKEGCLPLEFLPMENSINKNDEGLINLSASISSQYVSSILMVAPFYPSKKGLTLKLQGNTVISRPYIDMTTKMMLSFGIQVKELDGNKYFISSYSSSNATKSIRYINPTSYLIEGDASSATYPLAYAAITGTMVQVSNLGYNSMQGDSQFATKILQQMGCNVNQTETTTLVQGPPIGQLSALGRVDMELMTDAFLTLAILASIAVQPSLNDIPMSQGENGNTMEGINSLNSPGLMTEIVGIANQRVKECNRILAMVTELQKIGVNAYELETGIAIQPIPINELNAIFSNSNHEGVNCYDDHRVAMSFSLLGALLPGLVVLDKRCVEKTYPDWWDVLAASLGQNIHGYEVQSNKMEVGDSNQKIQEINDTSIVLIGMRGVGKSSVGLGLASLLRFAFLDLDALFESKFDISITNFVNSRGWGEFREMESELVIQTLESHPKNTVIATGGGIVELNRSREVLSGFVQNGGVCLFLKRDIKIISNELSFTTQDHRPEYSTEVESVYLSRLKYYKQCSNFEIDLTNLTVQENSYRILHLINSVTDREIKENMNSNLLVIPTSNSAEEFKPSYFLSLTYPDLSSVRSTLKDATIGCGAVELRVDLLDIDWDQIANNPNLKLDSTQEYIEKQLRILNEELDYMPIIYTIRTVGQGGQFPDQFVPSNLIALFEIALRFPVAFIDLQSDWNKDLVLKPIKERIKSSLNYTQTIISTHDLSGSLQWLLDNVNKFATNCQFMKPTVIKMVSVATNWGQNIQLLNASLEYRKQEAVQPYLIAINMAGLGQLTRIFNSCLTPVTSPILKIAAAPGQLSVMEIHKQLSLLNIVSPLQFYLFGTPISKSPSPTYHNSAFGLLNLPHQFHLCESDEIEIIKEAVLKEDFGGASVTIPNKVKVVSLCQHLTEEAKLIGAVNTLIPIQIKGILKNKSILGDNTDWIAIHDLIKTHLYKAPLIEHIPLILGCGGTSRAALFALFRLGFSKIYLFNRTPSNAHQLISEFEMIGHWKLIYVPSLEKLKPTIVIDTLPAHTKVLNSQMAMEWFPQKQWGLIVQLAYSKYSDESQLMLSSPYPSNIAFISGIEIFLKQAEYQFIKWTNLPAPVHILENNVQDFLTKK